ncbi:MAG: hypothetical protein R3F62_03355 [Planctomycetota bacterium]
MRLLSATLILACVLPAAASDPGLPLPKQPATDKLETTTNKPGTTKPASSPTDQATAATTSDQDASGFLFSGELVRRDGALVLVPPPSTAFGNDPAAFVGPASGGGYRLADGPLTQQMGPLVGLQVSVRGLITIEFGTTGGFNPFRLEVNRIVTPAPFARSCAITGDREDDPVEGPLLATIGHGKGFTLPIDGPLTGLLRARARNRHVMLRGFRVAGKDARLIVTGARATASRELPVFAPGANVTQDAPLGQLAAGEPVWVGPGRVYVTVESDAGLSGEAQLARLSFGERLAQGLLDALNDD